VEALCISVALLDHPAARQRQRVAESGTRPPRLRTLVWARLTPRLPHLLSADHDRL